MIVDSVKSFVLTEKSIRHIESQNRYTIDVDPRLTKPQIRRFVESVFGVRVLAINTHRPPRKKRRLGMNQGYKTQVKRAIVTLHKDDSINVYSTRKNVTE